MTNKNSTHRTYKALGACIYEFVIYVDKGKLTTTIEIVLGTKVSFKR